MKSPESPKKWIVDPEAASVVKDIFHMALEGKGDEAIARNLQERQIMTPTYIQYHMRDDYVDFLKQRVKN